MTDVSDLTASVWTYPRLRIALLEDPFSGEWMRIDAGGEDE